MKYRVQPALIKAVIWKESRFDPKARGLAGEIGLMQIMKDAAGDWARAENIVPFHHEHLTHPGSNTLAGTWYLRKALGALHRRRQLPSLCPGRVQRRPKQCPALEQGDGRDQQPRLHRADRFSGDEELCEIGDDALRGISAGVWHLDPGGALRRPRRTNPS